MKKFYILALVAAMFAACATDVTEDVAIEAPETLKVSFEEDTRIQLNEAGKTVWTKGDLVSVFFLSNANEKWQFQGETGARVGILKRVTTTEATQELSNIVVVYPYNENHYINPKSCNVRTTLPAVQHYLKNSYGLDGNILISQSEYNQFSLKNVCGWIKLQLTGNGEKVQSITLKGNNGEQVAGEIYINSADATVALAADMGGADDDENSAGGNLVFEDTIVKELTLDCGEGVTLSAEATAFYIGLPPQEFTQGISLEIKSTDGHIMTKSTNKSVLINRNAIQPMAALEVNFKEQVPYNEIWYTSYDGAIVTPYATDVFGANILSNTYENGKGVIKFDGDISSIGYKAFYNCGSLTSITIPDSVTEIGDFAFAGSILLNSISMPKNIALIGDFAFFYCFCLDSVHIADLFAWCMVRFTTLTSSPFAPSGAKLYFNDCLVEKLIIPSGITEINKYAFYGCSSLTNVTIPNDITLIGDCAFCCCRSLSSFSGKFASLDNRCLVVDGVLISFAPAGLTEYIIPDSVSSIRSSVFRECTLLTSVTIPDSVTSIGVYAFDNSTSLKEIYCKPTTPPSGSSNMFSDDVSGRKIYVPSASVDAYKAAKYWSDYTADIEGYDF